MSQVGEVMGSREGVERGGEEGEGDSDVECIEVRERSSRTRTCMYQMDCTQPQISVQVIAPSPPPLVPASEWRPLQEFLAKFVRSKHPAVRDRRAADLQVVGTS